MSQGQLWLFGKIKQSGYYVRNVVLDITGTFNMEDNLNDTPSNMKIKTITSDTYREEFEVNTIAYHPNTTTWWVIKADTSTYLQNGEYEHEIELVELLEFYSYRHLPNCAFAPNTYSLEQMLDRLFYIGKQNDITVTYPSFLDEDRQMPFMSFENYTIANAIKNIGRSINAIPKVVASITSGVIGLYIQGFDLTFINRVGNETTIKNVLNDQFPVAYEKNSNSSDQFTTRSVSNITNAKSSSLVVSPQKGGYKNISVESPLYDADTAKIYLPSKVDSVKELNIYPRVSLVYITFDGSDLVYNPIYKGYFFDESFWFEKFQESLSTTNKIRLYDSTELTVTSTIYGQLNDLTIDNFPNAKAISLVNSTDTISTSFDSVLSPWFKNKMTIKSNFDYKLEDTQAIQDRISYYETNTNTITMSKRFREGLSWASVQSSVDLNPFYRIYRSSTTLVYNSLYLMIDRDLDGAFADKTFSPNILVQVSYYPIADIKVSIDNDNNASDEKFFNQSGKIVDSVTVSKLITSHTNDSVEGTKIRNARYTDYNDIMPLGQIVRDNNQLYIVTQRSLDMMFANGNTYFNVIYTLSRNRIARSENIIADNSVISYKTPDDNLVQRTQLYKDYLELSLENINQDTPYLSMTKALVLSSNFAGTNFDYTALVKNSYGTSPTIVRYVKNPSVFDLYKSKLMNFNWQDNNIIDYRVERDDDQSPIQTPIVYTDSVGKATDFELLICNTQEIEEANEDYNDPTEIDVLVPFGDLTQIPTTFYTNDILADNRYSIRIQEPSYNKDPFEIPVFEYMLQVNDDYNPLGNIVVGGELLTSFPNVLRYHYVLSNTRFTDENAQKLYDDNPLTGNSNRRVTITRTSATQLDLDLFVNILVGGTRNTETIKHIGIYATDGTNVKFLFGINDYVESGSNDKSNITVFINNWKI
jgi:hypothetical protein